MELYISCFSVAEIDMKQGASSLIQCKLDGEMHILIALKQSVE